MTELGIDLTDTSVDVGIDLTTNEIELGIEQTGIIDYNNVYNKPKINSIELIGNKSGSDLGLQNSLSATQMLAVDSGITSEKVSSYDDKVKVTRNQNETLIFYKD